MTPRPPRIAQEPTSSRMAVPIPLHRRQRPHTSPVLWVILSRPSGRDCFCGATSYGHGGVESRSLGLQNNSMWIAAQTRKEGSAGPQKSNRRWREQAKASQGANCPAGVAPGPCPPFRR